MSETAAQYRACVLRQWRETGWMSAPDRLLTKRGKAAIDRLVKDGFLERDPKYTVMLRRTEKVLLS